MDVPGFFFIICPDPHISLEYAYDRCTEWGIADAAKLSFWGDEWPDRRFFYELAVRDLTGSKKVLLLRFANQLNAASWKDVSDKMKSPRPGTTVFFFLEGEWEKGRPSIPAVLAKLGCWELSQKRKWFFQSPGLATPKEIRNFIVKRASSAGLRLDGHLVDRLTCSVQPDAGAISNIVSQLSLLSESGRAITLDDLNHLTDYVPEIKLFDLLSNMQHGNVGTVWDVISSEEDGGEELLFPLLGITIADARALWKYLSGENQSFGSFKDSAFKEDLAEHLGFEGVARIFRLACSIDFAVKSGSVQPLGGFERFVSELAEIYAGGKPYAG